MLKSVIIYVYMSLLKQIEATYYYQQPILYRLMRRGSLEMGF